MNRVAHGRSNQASAPTFRGALSDGRTIDSEEVLGPPEGRRKLVVVGDTETTDGLVEHVQEADLMVIEATFLERDAATGSTSRPRAPAGKKQVLVIMDEAIVKSVKVAAVVGAILRGTDRVGEGALLLGDPSDYSIDDPQFEAVAPFLIQDAHAPQHSALIDAMTGSVFSDRSLEIEVLRRLKAG